MKLYNTLLLIGFISIVSGCQSFLENSGPRVPLWYSSDKIEVDDIWKDVGDVEIIQGSNTRIGNIWGYHTKTEQGFYVDIYTAANDIVISFPPEIIIPNSPQLQLASVQEHSADTYACNAYLREKDNIVYATGGYTRQVVPAFYTQYGQKKGFSLFLATEKKIIATIEIKNYIME